MGGVRGEKEGDLGPTEQLIVRRCGEHSSEEETGWGLGEEAGGRP